MEAYVAFTKIQGQLIQADRTPQLGEWLDAVVAGIQEDEGVERSHQYELLSELIGDFWVEHNDHELMDQLEEYLAEVCEECEELLNA